MIERLYAALLLTFPRRFRVRYETPMRQIFRERYRAACDDGVRARMQFILRSLLDILTNAALERLAAARDWLLFPNFHEQLARREQERRLMTWQAMSMDLRYA